MNQVIDSETEEVINIPPKKEKSRQYEIVNNVVQRVHKVRSGIGITSRGEDIDGIEIVINNVDAGDAVALYKVAHYGEGSGRRIGILFILFCTISAVIFFILLYWGYNKYIVGEVELPPVSPIEQSIPIAVPLDTTTGTGEQIEEEKFNLEHERYVMQAEFLQESLKLELQKRDLTITSLSEELSQKNKEIESKNKEIESKTTELSELKKILSEYTSKDTSKDGFLLELGREVDRKCRENESEECKNLYYNYIK